MNFKVFVALNTKDCSFLGRDAS